MMHLVIMAGGTGTRFWPLSRVKKPKQLLALASEKTMLRETVDRFASLVSPEQVQIVATETITQVIRDEFPELPENAIVAEPCGRNTAPCIALATLKILQDDPDATLIVVPADHYVRPVDVFCKQILDATKQLEKNPNAIVTLGIKPTSPSESFGYIPRKGVGVDGLASGLAFHEKPKKETAEKYVASGDYFWNSGVFVMRADQAAELFKAHTPELYSVLLEVVASSEYEAKLAEVYPTLESISFDYAIMEKVDEVLLLEAEFDWNDVGSWQALASVHPPDSDGNVLQGKTFSLESKNCIARSDDAHLTALFGVEDLIVVHTPDATLVASRKNEESMRQLVEALRDSGEKDYL